MVSPIYPGGTYPVGTTPYGKKSESEPARTSGQHYDQVQFSSHLSEAEKRVRETAGQITRQIRTRPSRQELDAPAKAEQKTPLEHFADFYQLQNNQPLTHEQAAFCQQLIESIWKEEDA